MLFAEMGLGMNKFGEENKYGKHTFKAKLNLKDISELENHI